MSQFDPIQENIDLIRPFHYHEEEYPLRATCFHPFGDVYAVGSNSSTLRLYAYPTYEQLKHFSKDIPLQEPEIVYTFHKLHRGSIYCVAFNSKGDLLATGSNDQTIRVIKYNPQTQLPESTENLLTMHTGTVRDVCFTPNSIISAGAGDNSIYITDINKFKSVQKFQGHSSPVMSLNYWNDECSMFVSGSQDGTIKLWDLRAKNCVSTFGTNSPGGDIQQQTGTPVGAVRVEHSGKLLVSGHSDGRCMLYELRAQRIIQMFKAHRDEIRSINFSPKTYYLLTTGYDGKIKLIDIQGDLRVKMPSVDIGQKGKKVIQTAWHPTEYNFVSTCTEGSTGSFTLWTLPTTSTPATLTSTPAGDKINDSLPANGIHNLTYSSNENVPSSIAFI